MAAVEIQLQQRQDVAADWTTDNPTLLVGEIGYESDTGLLKIGDGVTAWNSLGYWGTFDTVTLAGDLVISNADPSILFEETGATADNTKWDFIVDAEQFQARVLNDAESAHADWLTVDRTGNTIDQINLLGTTVDVSSTLDVGTEILLTERADHNFTPAATRGIVWLRSSDSGLVFTDGAGTDWQLNDQATPPGGADTTLQYNNAGAFGGMSQFTYDGTDLIVAGGSSIRLADTAPGYIEWDDTDLPAGWGSWRAGILSGAWAVESLNDAGSNVITAISASKNSSAQVPVMTLRANQFSFLNGGGAGSSIDMSNHGEIIGPATIRRTGGFDQITIRGGSTGSATAQLILNGGSFGTTGGDFQLQHNLNNVIWWDASLGTLGLYGGTAGKTLGPRIEADGQTTFFQDVSLNSTSPYISYVESDGALDQKVWFLGADTEAFNGIIFDDALTNFYQWLSIQRSGTGASIQVDTIDFTAVTDITLNTAIVNLGTMSFDADQTIGAGQDNYVLTYDNGTGLISLEAAGGTIGGSIVDGRVAVGSATDEIEGTTNLLFDDFLRTLTIGSGGGAARLILNANTNSITEIQFQELGSDRVTIRNDDDQYLDFRHFNTGTGALRFYDGDGLSQGWLSWDGVASPNGPSFGFKNGNGQWRLKLDNGADEITAYNTTFIHEASGPSFKVDNTAAALDEKVWEWVYSGGIGNDELQLNIWDDAEVNSYSAIQILRSGTGAGVQVDTIDLTAVTDITMNTGTLISTGTIQANGTVTSAGAIAGLIINETDAGLDQKVWVGPVASGEALFHYITDDVGGNIKTWCLVQRSGTGTGTQIDTIDFAAVNDVTINSTLISTGTGIFPAATTSIPSIRLPHGTPPSSPTNGDFWTTTGGAFAQINGATRQLDLNTGTKETSFDSPSGSSGTFYFAGFYLFHTSAFTPTGTATNVGTANASYAAHALVVLGAASTNMVVRVTGTSINDSGTRVTSDFEDIDTSGGSANDYFETTKKFIGQVGYTLQSGTGVTINAGFAKYWDNQNSDFTVTGCEAVWLGGANDSGADIELLHHKSTGWTYGAGGSPTTPTALASMATDHSTESGIVNGQDGAWKRTNLSQAIAGSGSEGIMWRITTTANRAFELGNLQVTWNV